MSSRKHLELPLICMQKILSWLCWPRLIKSMMTAEWDKLTTSAKCLLTLCLPVCVLCTIAAVNCSWAQLLLGSITHVREGIGLFLKKAFVLHKQNTNMRLIQCKLVAEEQTVAFIQLKGWKMWSYVTKVSIGRAALNSLFSQAADLIIFISAKSQQYTQSLTDAGHVLEKNLPPTTWSKYWVLADLFNLS